jgi:CHAT domain-containing protein
VGAIVPTSGHDGRSGSEALPSEGRAGAIQQAEVALLQIPATMHPHYWAPFLLLGAR